MKDGEAAYQQEGRAIDYAPPAPGIYRVEAELWIRNEWTPWIYSNPIFAY